MGRKSEHKAQIDDADLETQGAPSLAEMLQRFKRGLAREIGPEDIDIHYDLAVAFKEMGLLDEAIEQLHRALPHARLRFKCLTLLGLCYLEQGEARVAVDWIEQALATTGPGSEERRALSYELGRAYEMAGAWEEARALYAEIHEQDAGYRDVGGRIRALGVSRATPPAASDAARGAQPRPSRKREMFPSRSHKQ
jgi:pilus assembly protein FimV